MTVTGTGPRHPKGDAVQWHDEVEPHPTAGDGTILLNLPLRFEDREECALRGHTTGLNVISGIRTVVNEASDLLLHVVADIALNGVPYGIEVADVGRMQQRAAH